MKILNNKKVLALLLMLILVMIMGLPAVIFASDVATTTESGALSSASIVWTDILFIGVAFAFAGGLLFFIKKRNNA